jgi:protein-disulfide isomerase
MPSHNQPTKQQRRDAARAERQAQETAAAAAAARRRRLAILGGIVAAVAAVLVVVVLATGGSGDKAPANASGGAPVAGVKESTAMLAGVPQSGRVLGDPKAPVTMIEFADLQCPICRDYSLNTQPQIVQDYVRTGKVRVELRLLTFLGEDSVRGAAVANAAAKQDRLFNFADVFYFNQGKEKTGYATDAFLRKIAGAVPGLDPKLAFADRTQQSVVDENAAADALAAKHGVQGTPSFAIGPTGGTLELAGGFDLGTLKTALDGALKASAAS